MDVYGHQPGQPLECPSLVVKLVKEKLVGFEGQTAYRVGFKIGGGIDQDRKKAPFKYPDSGIYVTYVDPDSPAEEAGLQKHDKILEINGNDFTMVTHDKAVKYIKKDFVLNMLVTRPEVAFSKHLK